MFSVATISLAVIQKVYFISDSPADKYSTVLGVTLGAFLLAVSLLEAGKGNSVFADALNCNAEELTSLTNRLDVRIAAQDEGQAITAADLEKLNDEYDQIKARCVTNHAANDYLHFLGEKLKAHELARMSGGNPPVTRCQAVRYHIRWLISDVWYIHTTMGRHNRDSFRKLSALSRLGLSYEAAGKARAKYFLPE